MSERRTRVLLVDDDESFRRVHEYQLDRAGYEVDPRPPILRADRLPRDPDGRCIDVEGKDFRRTESVGGQSEDRGAGPGIENSLAAKVHGFQRLQDELGGFVAAGTEGGARLDHQPAHASRICSYQIIQIIGAARIKCCPLEDDFFAIGKKAADN